MHTTSVRASSDADDHRRTVITAPATPSATRPSRSHASAVEPDGPAREVVAADAEQRGVPLEHEPGAVEDVRDVGEVPLAARDAAQEHVEDLEDPACDLRGEGGDRQHGQHGQGRPPSPGDEEVGDGHERRGHADRSRGRRGPTARRTPRGP